MFPQETLVQMFANIKSIYQFHAEFVLPPVSFQMDSFTWNYLNLEKNESYSPK